MGGLFRKLLIYICKPVYSLIVYVYKIFYSIATTRFLNNDIIQQLSSNIYILVSAIMLFAFSITILSAIVNPDLLTDNKKGVTALFKRSIIALALMVLVPFAFDELYKIQDNVMSNSLIERIVVGISYECDSDSSSDCEKGGNGGQVIAGTLISSVLYPEEKLADSDGEIKVPANISESYEKMVSENIRYMGAIAKNINVTVDGSGGNDNQVLKWDFDDDAYAFHFDGLLAVVVGLAILYILVIYAIDIAVRVFKLAFLELTAPISIVAYVGVGDKMLSSWFKELGKTYAELFVRIVAIAFYLFLIHNLDSFMGAFTSSDSDWTFVLKVFFMVGMLIFVKQVPDMLGRIFGVDIKLKGGIAGRLGEMAGVGNVAKKAWESVRNPLAAAAGVGSLAAGTISHLGAGITGAWTQGRARAEAIRAEGGHAAALRGFLSGAGRGIGSALTTPGAAVRSLRAGVTNRNLGSIGSEWDRDRDLHPDGSTFVGRTIDDVRTFFGAQTRQGAADRTNEHLRYTYVDDAGNQLQLTQEQFNTIRDSYKNVEDRRNAIRDAATHAIESERSIRTTTIDGVTGNYHDLSNALDTLKSSGPQNGETQTQHQQRVINFETALRNWRNDQRNDYIDHAINGTLNQNEQSNDSVIIETQFAALNHDLNANAINGTRHVANRGDIDTLHDYTEGQITIMDVAEQQHDQEVRSRRNSEEYRSYEADSSARSARHQSNNSNNNNGNHN